MLSTIPEIDALRAQNAGNVTRKGNFDVLSDGRLLCHIPFLGMFLFKGVPYSNPLVPGVRLFEAYAAAILAIQHLNSGDGSIVRELDGLDQRCPIRFTTEFHGAENFSTKSSVQGLLEIGSRELGGGKPLPCAFAGGWLSGATIATSTISGLTGYPQISPTATASGLDDKSQHPLFSRTMPPDMGDAVAAVEYFHHVLKIENIALVHINDPGARSFANTFQDEMKAINPAANVLVIDIPYEPTEESVSRAVRILKDSQLKYFFGVMCINQQKVFFPVAVEGGIAETDHNWFWSTCITGDIPKGSGAFAPIGGLAGMPGYDQMALGLKSMKNEGDIEVLASKMPTYDRFTLEESRAIFAPVLEDKEFLMDVGKEAPFTYDAFIALGLSACNITSSTNDDKFTGENHNNVLKQLKFQGASGNVVFDSVTGSRLPKSTHYSLSNSIPVDSDGNFDANGAKLARRISHVFTDGKWTEMNPYIYSDGSTSTPAELPLLEVNNNYLHPAFYAIGFTLAAFGMFMAIVFSLWAAKNKKSFVIRASQPIFMQLICFGCLILASSIIPLGFDPGLVSVNAASRACMAFPWLLTIGISVTFSALQCKTRRILKVMTAANAMRRVTVTPRQVMQELALFVGSNVVVLICWTVIDPLVWETDVLDVDFFDRSIETRGFCRSAEAEGESDPKNSIYWIVLAVINIGSISVAFYSAYKARNIDTNLAESRYIFDALGVMIIAGFMGIPVLIIAKENQNAFYFVFSAIIFVIVASVLGFIFVPKMQRWRKGETEDSMLNRNNVSGATAPTASQVRHMPPNAESSVAKQHEETIETLQKELREAREANETLKNKLAEVTKN